MKSRTRTLLSLVIGLILSPVLVSAHCQVPCGIYADDVVFGELETDVATIEKAMRQITALAESGDNPQQLTRWVMNKESHAQNIQDRMSAYFLAQRIKLSLKASDPARYSRLVELCHQITVLAMQCKQGTDLAKASSLHDALHAFQDLYAK
jgi:hypothetical protein